MQDQELAFTPAWQMRQMLDSKEVSSLELTELFLRRIEEFNPKLNAYLTVTGDEAIDAAKAADVILSRGDAHGPLLGIPISVKDLEATRGIRTTYGSLAYKDAIPEADSVVAERVRLSGAALLGKTNTPEFGLQGSTENRLGDPCRNPWNLERTSGGSSGGAGAAVAAGLGPLAAGTDGGGSIRNPSSFNGLFGIKPSLGRVPKAGGLGRPAPNLTSQSGPMARNVRDAAMLLQVLAGYDPRDPGSLRQPVPDFTANLDEGARGLRIAWSSNLGYAVVDPEVVKITSQAARLFEELGCVVNEPAFAMNNPSPAHLTIFFVGNYATFGHLLEEQPENLSDNARFCLEQGKKTTGHEYALAIREVQIMRDHFDELLENYDLLLTPTMAVPPFPIGQPPDHIGGVEVVPRTSYSPLTRAFNVTGLPAASIPVGFSAEGLPIGMQMVGRFGEETTVLRAAAAFEQARPWAQHRPGGC